MENYKKGRYMKSAITLHLPQIHKHYKDLKVKYREDKPAIYLEYNDFVILDLLYGICNSKSGSIVRYTFENEVYSWVAHSLILKQLEMLRIKKDALRNRIKKLEVAGLIKRQIQKVVIEKKNGHKHIFDGDFYTMGEKSDFIYWTKEKEGIDHSQGGALTTDNTLYAREKKNSLSLDHRQGNNRVFKGSVKDSNKEVNYKQLGEDTYFKTDIIKESEKKKEPFFKEELTDPFYNGED